MALPERVFYPLDKAAKRINSVLDIDIDKYDLLHFAYIRKLELCIPFFFDYSDKRDVKIDLNELVRKLSTQQFNNLESTLDSLEGKEFFCLGNGYGNFKIAKVKYTSHGVIRAEASINYCQILLAIHWMFIPIDLSLKPREIEISLGYFPRNSQVCALFDENISNLSQFIKYITFNKNHKVSIDDFVITSQELDLFLRGGESVPDDKFIPNVGRRENPYNSIILDIVRMTREKYSDCTGESLARKINKLLDSQPNALSFGSIKQLISRHIPTPKYRNTKLKYELVIPEHLSYLKNK